MRYTRRRLLEAATAGSLAFAGCLGGGTDTGTGTSTTTGTATGTGTPTGGGASAREKYPDYDWSKLEGATPVATSTIAMAGFSFEPLVTAVAPGTEVTVENRDGSSHTVTIPKLGVDDPVPGGESTSFTAGTEGRFEFVCTLHPPDMVGRLVVTENPRAVASGSTSTPTGAPTSTPTSTPTGAPTSTPTSTPTGTPTTAPSGSAVVAATGSNVFDPERLSVAVGETVTWKNTASGYYASHTVTSARFHGKAADWSMDVTLDGGEQASHTFDSAGVYEYYCTIHGKSRMCGVVLVGDVSLEKPLPCE